jgi:tRNA threonylcarbamoyladenosine biosynthesis protein TsaE
VGRELASEIVASSTLPRFIAMEGDLGVGKTVFVRGFTSAVSPGSAVRSPTFALVNEYRKGSVPVFHFDMYRISTWDDLYSTGYFDYLDAGEILAVEWSENIENALPQNTWYIEFEFLGENERKITIYHKDEEM